ncbi:hypothetical protein DPMN_051515 [Dreissena polymorpha]|uniref:Uncharacterized protein n=1 Tax=Dreissena polymorpha TaxID=45954 RepID=A0A9D4HNZ7_DREPO|nr:hypothetical protein DPMN_051515 [Dreissena polymorpha]
MERLAKNEEVCVPRNSLSCVLSKCKCKGAAFTFKKLIKGFFEPEQLVDRKAVEMATSNKIMKAIKSKIILNKIKPMQISLY